jgi:uncharacterized membrane protein
MKGWRITPLGWLLLAVIVGLVIYFGCRWVYRRLHYPPKGEEGQTSS